MQSPILFMVFNRPDVTSQVFQAIRAAKPKRLFVSCDGPRDSKVGEAEKVAQTRQIFEAVDWDCQLETQFFDKNHGCRVGVTKAIDWFFSQVEEGIILEDDCLPHPDFFAYADQLLERYRNDERIMMIGGDNPRLVNATTQDSYFFTKYTFIWGWATWRRAWAKYERDLSQYHRFFSRPDAQAHFANKAEYEYWRKNLLKVLEGKIDTWDYQWGFTSILHNGLNIVPRQNLVSNIGFGQAATHTHHANERANQPGFPMDQPLRHPVAFVRDLDFDLSVTLKNYQYPGLLRRVLHGVWNRIRLKLGRK